MKFILITGASGLIGSECSEFFLDRGFKIIGIDNNSRKKFFGRNGSITKRKNQLLTNKNYLHFDLDIRNKKRIDEIFSKYKSKIDCIVHCAAQPSHDWAVKDMFLDYQINSTATLILLNAYKNFCPEIPFIYVSTNKVYGDNPNKIKLIEKKLRFEVDRKSSFYKGVNESMSIDNCVHSFFGASKLSADLYVQEFGKNYNLPTVSFRGGCLTGENHSGVELHGFLSYIIKSIVHKNKYKIFGYKGKQVRDNIHSSDLINCFWHFYKSPRVGEVYNIGGGRENSCSILEVLSFFKKKYDLETPTEYINRNRTGDHMWWISDYSKFKKHYPKWKIQVKLEDIYRKIAENELVEYKD